MARAYLSNLGFRVPRGDQAHAYLWRRLQNCADPPVQRAGSELNLLRGIRNTADYRIDEDIDQDVARVQVAAARLIAQTLAMDDPTRLAAVAQAIRNYERDVLREVTWHA